KAYEAIRQARPARRSAVDEARGGSTPAGTLALPSVHPPAVQEAALARAPAALDAPPDAAAAASKPFDPYAFGLVPIYQKEGREALRARLGDVATADHLRQM